MKLTVIFAALSLFFVISHCDVFGLGRDFGLPTRLMSINPQNGYNKLVADLSQDLVTFTTSLNITAYDGNSEQFIIGNADPPTLALVNTFSKKTSMLNLPQYGQLLSFTVYDGIIYTLIGNDPDIPYLGHLVATDIVSRDTVRLAKVKIDPSRMFKVGAPMVYMAQNKIWVTEIMNSPVLLITVANNVSSVYETKIKGGWDFYWNDVNTNSSFVGYMNGMVAQIDPFAGNINVIRAFQCEGFLSVAFQYDEIYHLSQCTTNLTIETIDFSNTTTGVAVLDPSLKDIAAIHTAAAYVPYGCGMPCGVNTDCETYPTCHTCRLGHCSDDGDCGSFCETNLDCYAGACVGNCEYNRCGRKGCGSSCVNHEDCVAVSLQCQTCRLGRCSDNGNCGAYCLNNLDCYGGACVNNCTKFACTEDRKSVV